MDFAGFAALVAGISGLFALGMQIRTIIKNRKQEQERIDEALDKQPEIRRQLELGNIGEAVKHLNMIIESQAAHIKRQDERIQFLTNRNAALEAEVSRYEKIVEEQGRKLDQCAENIAMLTEKIRRLREGTSG